MPGNEKTLQTFSNPYYLLGVLHDPKSFNLYPLRIVYYDF